MCMPSCTAPVSRQSAQINVQLTTQAQPTKTQNRSRSTRNVRDRPRSHAHRPFTPSGSSAGPPTRRPVLTQSLAGGKTTCSPPPGRSQWLLPRRHLLSTSVPNVTPAAGTGARELEPQEVGRPRLFFSAWGLSS
jgi:hypothetical protein